MSLAEILAHRRIVVCAGAGGVGKTTIATSLALAAAKAGRRVLVLTIDPSRRLADVLGVPLDATTPVPLDLRRSAEAGLGEGRLDIALLHPRAVVHEALARLPDGAAKVRELTENRIFREGSRMVVGMQEYTAMEALHAHVASGRWDLVVLDTPPSRHALDFLEGPLRLGRFLDGRVAHFFLPSARRRPVFGGAAMARLLGRILGAVFGEGTYRELQEVLVSFAGLFAQVNVNAKAMSAMLADPSVAAFVVVTSPANEALAEAHHVGERAAALGLPVAAYVLNRSHARAEGRVAPPSDAFGPRPTAVQAAALAKLRRLAALEEGETRGHRSVLENLRASIGATVPVVAAPFVAEAAPSVAALASLGETLARDPSP